MNLKNHIMKALILKQTKIAILLLAITFSGSANAAGFVFSKKDKSLQNENFVQFKGKIVDVDNQSPLIFATSTLR